MKILDVHMGEVKIARQGETLKAILGSCVGIGILWKERHVCGLAHCLLPESPVQTFQIGARFVDQAMRSLIALMRIRADDAGVVEVVIVGGGNMISPGVVDKEDLVGAHNFKVAMREAKRHNLHVVYSEGGGESGRKIFINSTDYSYKVEFIPRNLETIEKV
jgi:chemotaxis protein CheD